MASVHTDKQTYRYADGTEVTYHIRVDFDQMSAERCPCCGCLLADHLFGREMETPGCKSCMCLNDPSNSQWHHTLAPDIQATVDRCRERAAQAQGRKQP